MDKQTIKISVIKYLESQGPTFGGKMARELARELEHKESVIERRARELVQAGVLKADYVQIDGAGPRCVKYSVVEDTICQKPHNNGAEEDCLECGVIRLGI